MVIAFFVAFNWPQGMDYVVSLLIEKGANINGTANAGYTALMHATKQGRDNIVLMLTRKGAALI